MAAAQLKEALLPQQNRLYCIEAVASKLTLRCLFFTALVHAALVLVVPVGVELVWTVPVLVCVLVLLSLSLFVLVVLVLVRQLLRLKVVLIVVVVMMGEYNSARFTMKLALYSSGL